MTAARARSGTRSIRLGRLGLGLGLGIGLVTTAPFATPAAAVGCPATQIAVVVSFNELGGGTQTACIDDVDSGFAALAAAGFSVTPVSGQPFVCRINDVPAADPCRRIPPASAYWAYWSATMGGTWSYSTAGAGSRDPAPGDVEGWSFGADATPGIEPPAVESGAAAGTAEPETSASEDLTAASPAPDGGLASDSASDSDSVPAGPPWAVLGTVAGLAVLGGAGYWQYRRRNSVPPGTGP